MAVKPAAPDPITAIRCGAIGDNFMKHPPLGQVDSGISSDRSMPDRVFFLFKNLVG